MAVFNGTVYLVSVNGLALKDQTEGSISLSMETRDTTTKSSSGFRELLEGVRSGSISVSGLVDDTDSAVTTLSAAFAGRSSFSVKFGVDTGTHDDVFTCAKAYVTSLEVSAGTEDNVTYSASIELSGAITHDPVD